MTEYKIEKGITPPEYQHEKLDRLASEMEEGDSMVVDMQDHDYLVTAIRRLGYNTKHGKLADGRVRVWKMEKR